MNIAILSLVNATRVNMVSSTISQDNQENENLCFSRKLLRDGRKETLCYSKSLLHRKSTKRQVLQPYTKYPALTPFLMREDLYVC